MSVLIIAFMASLLITLWIVRSSHLHGSFTGDSDLSGVQKFHTVAVPRVGGVAIILGVFLALTARYFQNAEVGTFGLLLLLSALPAFLSGLTEDITKKVGVKIRLLATALSAGLAGYFLNAWLNSVQVLGIDDLMMTYPIAAIAITCFAVSGVANAFNIIDGYNGSVALLQTGYVVATFVLGLISFMTSLLIVLAEVVHAYRSASWDMPPS